MVTIYHNPRCSKSRQTLALIEENGHKPQVIEYLKTPPAENTLQELIASLGFQSARELMRTKEEIYKELNLSDESLQEADLVKSMAEHPKLIERPIVITDKGSCLGRPPENVLAIL